SSGRSLRKSSRSRNGSNSEVVPKPKARRSLTPAPSTVGCDCTMRLTGRMDMEGALWMRRMGKTYVEHGARDASRRPCIRPCARRRTADDHVIARLDRGIHDEPQHAPTVSMDGRGKRGHDG